MYLIRTTVNIRYALHQIINSWYGITIENDAQDVVENADAVSKVSIRAHGEYRTGSLHVTLDNIKIIEDFSGASGGSAYALSTDNNSNVSINDGWQYGLANSNLNNIYTMHVKK